MRGGVKAQYFEAYIGQSFTAGTNYSFSLADFNISGITPKGFAWENISGNQAGDNTTMPRWTGTNIVYTPSVSNSSFMRFKGIVFY